MELTIDQEKNIAYVKMVGHVNSTDFLDAFSSAISDKRYNKGMGRLWDFIEADLSWLKSSTVFSMAKKCWEIGNANIQRVASSTTTRN